MPEASQYLLHIVRILLFVCWGGGNGVRTIGALPALPLVLAIMIGSLHVVRSEVGMRWRGLLRIGLHTLDPWYTPGGDPVAKPIRRVDLLCVV